MQKHLFSSEFENLCNRYIDYLLARTTTALSVIPVLGVFGDSWNDDDVHLRGKINALIGAITDQKLDEQTNSVHKFDCL